jgi:hypothetical protein
MPKNDNPQALRFLASMAKHGEQAAGERFAEEHPLGKSADISKRSAWAKALCGYLNDRYDEETVKAIRMDCACGPYAINGKLKALYEKSDGPADFVKKVNELDPGFSLEYDGTSYYVVYPQCYCSCVKRTDGQLPKAWCYCTLGYSRRMFETILGKETEGELLSSIKAGDTVCRIRITVQA